MLPMRMSPLEYGAGVGLISVEPPPLVLWTLSTVVLSGRDGPWSRPSCINVSLVRKRYCAPFWQEHALHTLLFWQHG